MIPALVIGVALMGAGAWIGRHYRPGYLAWYLRIRLIGPRLKSWPATVPADGLRVVVSLSSIPSRLPHIFPALNSLLGQTRPADALYLNLPHWSIREKRAYRIPSALAADGRIVVNRIAADLGPITKLVPVLRLETDPRTLIVTVDDDAVYPPDLLATLIRFHRLLPAAALGLRGYRLPASGRYLEARIQCASTIDRPLAVDVITAVSGALYRRAHFRPDFCAGAPCPPQSVFVDDAVIGAYLHAKAIPRYIVPYRLREPFSSYIITCRSNPLWKINRDGRNDQTVIDHGFGNAGPPQPTVGQAVLNRRPQGAVTEATHPAPIVTHPGA